MNGEKLVKRYAGIGYIQGSALRAQRRAAGLSLRALAARLGELTGRVFDHRQIWRQERMFEFPVDADTEQALRRIFEKY